ncbi:MAG: PD40 domain-containing protein [Myxococcales bacterium]|nr:PD40 domain-containing protein [Myxococcales bacterium]MCB9627362.1 PD40 domain-containing protein [Sandaracinaceae bacterium]
MSSRRTLRAGVALLCAWLALLTLATGGRAQVDGLEDELAVRLPVRLTAGHSNHLMASYSDTNDALYFVGDEVGTTEILVQSPPSSAPVRLFEALGDHAFPRVSPDGRRIAYLSFVHDAKGDVCVRNLPNGAERCVTDDETAELEVIWLDEGSQLGVLSRRDLHSGFVFQAIPATGGAPRTILQRDMIGLSRSADGERLAYVAVEARRPEIGVSFASRVGRGIHVVPLGRGAEGARPAVFVPDLPGVSGFPAFSRDGRFIYFSQYLNDTNRDGVIDGRDNSVIARVGFDASRADPFEGQTLEQLTSSRWNCHYPAPGANRLQMTCSHGGSLDIYALPLDGVVPASWDLTRLRAELHVARDRWAQLLVASRLLVLLPDAAERLSALQEVVALHLDLREYESAIYYAERLAARAGAGTAMGGWAQLMDNLARHRREDLALARGQLSRAYVDSERARLAAVRALCPTGSGAGGPTASSAAAPPSPADTCALSLLVASELLDDLGDKAEALTTLDRLRSEHVTGLGDPHTLRLYGAFAARFYGHLADREARVSAQAALAAHPALSVQERIVQALDVVTELTRGRAREAANAALQQAHASAPAGGELALMLEVELALRTLLDPLESSADERELGDEAGRAAAVRRVEEAARERLFALYTGDQDTDRRRAIALRTVQFASRHGSEYLQYQFATTWASGVRAEAPERRYAEELYRAIVLERAYGELHENDLREAAGYFFQASRNPGMLDAHVGFIEARAAQGEDVRAFYDERFARTPDEPAYLFARAYLDARELPAVPRTEAGDQRFAEMVSRCLTWIARVDEALPRDVTLHQLWGYVRHEQARRERSRVAAAEANHHYLLALDLAQTRPRAQAALLQALGTLQASLGNHRRAVEHLERRARLPFTRPEAQLAFHLTMARSLFHARRQPEAVAAAREALTLLEAHPELRRHRAMVLDQLAFQLARQDEHAEAAQHYELLLTALEGEDDTPVNRLKALIGLSAERLSLGQHERALQSLDQAGALLRAHRDIRSRPEGSLLDRYVYGHERYEALLAGLRAEALVGLGRKRDAEEALARRSQLLARFFEESDSDDDLLPLAQVCLRRAVVARAEGDLARARTQLEQGLAHVALFNERTGSVVTDVSQGLLVQLAELVLFEGVSRTATSVDIEAQLAAAYAFMTRFPSPRWRRDRLRLELYLTLLRLRAE